MPRGRRTLRERISQFDSYRLLANLFQPLCLYLEAEDFAGLALREDLKRATANLTIGGESLLGDGCIDHQFHALTAVRALDFFTFLHHSPWSGTGYLPSGDQAQKN